MYLRTRIHPRSEADGELYLSCLFFGLVHMLFNGFSELSIMIARLPIFYKQRDNQFHPTWAWTLASWILRVPYSVVEAIIWSCVVYYPVGFAPSAGRYHLFVYPICHIFWLVFLSSFPYLLLLNVFRFFRFMLTLFAVHQMALGLFRGMAAIARDMIIANTFGTFALLVIFLLGGFIIPKGRFQSFLFDLESLFVFLVFFCLNLTLFIC